MEQKEYPVGSRFQVDGQWYEVKPSVEDYDCALCCFYDSKTFSCKKPMFYPECFALQRNDNADVYYVRIDPPTDTLDTKPLTREIGSHFYDNGVKLKVCEVENELFRCSVKCFYHDILCGNLMHIHGLCGSKTRSDHKLVYFEEDNDEKR